jgi:hypothetical protein
MLQNAAEVKKINIESGGFYMTKIKVSVILRAT